jgi:hypothetical protein
LNARASAGLRDKLQRAQDLLSHTPAGRDEVFGRDGEQCTYVAKDGQRCSSRSLLELDHIRPRALGGADDATNLRISIRPPLKLPQRGS